jgi:acetyltransferase-like isoleucine patch superfamily enzyme
MPHKMTKFTHINDTSRPLIFLGTNINLYQHAEIAQANGIKVAGVIDSDYYGNTDYFCDLPVIDKFEAFEDPERLAEYKEKYNFFCAVTALPEKDPVTVRNYNKRMDILRLIDQLELPCISIVSQSACVSPSAIIGKGVFIDHFANIESKVEIEDYVTIFGYTMIAHFTKVGRNCQFQRHAGVGSFSTVGENTHFSPLCKALRANLTFGKNTWLQQGIAIMRGTVENEIVSIHGPNIRRVSMQQHIVE